MKATVHYRQLNAADTEILRVATLINVNWAGEERFTYRDIDEAPSIRHYYVFNAERGDFGFVAQQNRLVLGVVWVLFLDQPDPGFGYVRTGVPELGISVYSGYRGRGIGGELLTRALEQARARGLPGVSLSVEAGNPALRLYRRFGFEPVTDAAAGVYAIDL